MRFFTPLAASALLALTVQAHAQTYSVTYTGVVAPGSYGDTNNLFGGGNLAGDAFSLTFTYAFQGGEINALDEQQLFGGTFYSLQNPILANTLSINGHGFSLQTNYSGVVDIDTPPAFYGTSDAQLLDASGNRVQGVFVDPAWNDVADLKLSQFDASLYDTTSQTYGLFVFDGELLELDSQTVDLNGFAVPEPAAFGLMIVGLTMVGLIRRKKGR